MVLGVQTPGRVGRRQKTFSFLAFVDEYPLLRYNSFAGTLLFAEVVQEEFFTYMVIAKEMIGTPSLFTSYSAVS